jgi:hypothetical protein
VATSKPDVAALLHAANNMLRQSLFMKVLIVHYGKEYSDPFCLDSVRLYLKPHDTPPHHPASSTPRPSPAISIIPSPSRPVRFQPKTSNRHSDLSFVSQSETATLSTPSIVGSPHFTCMQSHLSPTTLHTPKDRYMH